MSERQIFDYLRVSSSVRLWKTSDAAAVLNVSVKTVNKLVLEQRLACMQATCRDQRCSQVVLANIGGSCKTMCGEGLP